MSKTLNLVDDLLCRARHCHDMGLHDRAKTLFERLAEFRRLPAEVAEETQGRLADLCRAEEDAFKERQHLACALAQRPNNADYHFRMAEAFLDDEDAPLEKALPYLRAAVRIEPDNPRYVAELGALSMRLGQTAQGLRLLKKAYDLAGDNLNVVEQYATALVDEDRADAARDLLKTAMFRNSSDRRFRELYRDFQFRAIADDQANKESIAFPDDAPVILRFVRSRAKTRRFTVDGQILRIDGAEPLSGPTRRTPSRKKQSP